MRAKALVNWASISNRLAARAMRLSFLLTCTAFVQRRHFCAGASRGCASG